MINIIFMVYLTGFEQLNGSIGFSNFQVTHLCGKSLGRVYENIPFTSGFLKIDTIGFILLAINKSIFI